MQDPASPGSRFPDDQNRTADGLPDFVPSGWSEEYAAWASATVETRRSGGPSASLVPAGGGAGRAMLVALAGSVIAFVVFSSLAAIFALSSFAGLVVLGGGMGIVLWTTSPREPEPGTGARHARRKVA
jgi:hypothetical protein